LETILNSATTDAALAALSGVGVLEPTMERITAAVGQQLQHRAGEKLRVEAVVFSNTFGLLGKTVGADSLLRRHRKET
jgi:cobalt-precorrin-5B (C1)-methyltransferase